MIKQILRFGAEWCGPCRQMNSILSGFDRIPIKYIDADVDSEGLIKKYGIKSLPTFLFMDEDDNIIERKTGLLTLDKINQIIDSYEEEK